MKTVIKVTRHHIKTAKIRDSLHCMVTDALRDAGRDQYPLADIQSIRWSDMRTGKRYFYLTPPAVQQAIIAFDQGRKVKPFTFTLGKPLYTRPVRREWRGTGAVLKKARAKYEQVSRNVVKKARRRIAREREFGVRMLQP